MENTVLSGMVQDADERHMAQGGEMQDGLSALVVEGGAMRSIFAAGVLDAFLDAGHTGFDRCIGV